MFRMTVHDVFAIKGRGLVATGHVVAGELRVGDEVQINGGRPIRVNGIEAFRKKLDHASVGDNVGLLLGGVDRSEVGAGAVITSAGAGYDSSLDVIL